MAVNSYGGSPTPGPLGERPYGADFDSGLTTRPFTLLTEAGVVAAYLWVEAGKLYIKADSVAPTTATDGTIVGAQTA